ncbi:unnamed protein product [Mycena citricolor]|uniref:Dolichol-phosphate mannosyltransferase subunit 3 n=1 Tax=Mycena citricolor TaxID=2018698 RepID=A0AAD2Q116_9AGAR|nr:unnamed protein product [Mycena citricolor]CAK5279802.1 unnamed protein product [Mycena citricolor]
MARAHRIGLLSALFVSLWTLVFFEFFSVPLLDDGALKQVWPLLPWWSLVSFGSYSLASLGWGLFSFRDCPEAYQELMSEISLAKDDLRRKGVSVD